MLQAEIKRIFLPVISRTCHFSTVNVSHTSIVSATMKAEKYCDFTPLFNVLVFQCMHHEDEFKAMQLA